MIFTGGDVLSALLISLGIVSAILMWVDITSISENAKKTILVILLIYACICGCYAFPDSADFYTYYDVYYAPSSEDFDFKPFQFSYLDYGFLWLWTLIKSFGGDIYTAYFVTCIISLFLYYKSICQYTKCYFCAWAFILVRTFYISNIVQIRQGLASSILLYSLKYIEESCFFKFCFCVLLATLFHQSFVLALLIYPMGKIKWTNEKFIIIMMIILIVGATSISDYFFEAIQLVGLGVDKLMSYSGSGFFKPTSLGSLFFRMLITVYLIFCLLKHKGKYKDTFVGMLVIGCAITLFFSSYSVFERLASSFLLCIPFAIPLLFCNIHRLNEKAIMIILLEIIFFILLVKNYTVVTI